MLNEITLIYKIEKNKNRIRIFGEIFVNNNKSKCYIKYKDKKYELDTYFLKTISLVTTVLMLLLMKNWI